MIQIKNLHIKIGDKEILKGLDLSLEKGKVHVLMGVNGSGKSTLTKAIAGHFDIEVLDGEILYKNKNLLDLPAEERALEGVFLSFQNPTEIAGVNNAYFLRTALNAKEKHQGKKETNAAEFLKLMRKHIENLGMSQDMIARSLNDGFSGGEKKRNEILQMEILEPDVVMLDEIDSGLDIDALKAVAEGINRMKNDERTFLIITHYRRILDYIAPDFVHILQDGRIVKTGGLELVDKLESEGYDAMRKDM
ncbi:MAG: Fe-S cluster assembly ATP-binding protein [Sulfurimonas sp.]|jgi:Fe-S cluster assembly ATP-binding protein|uniref:Fe-S cluster assembly ATPase SufC n=1 Tax=Sulfurimonas sp. TaxID=2022749 RepID=UPI0039E3B94B